MNLVQEIDSDRVYLFGESVRQLFVTGLQIHDLSDIGMSDCELIEMNRQHDSLLLRLVDSGFPLDRAVRMSYNDESYLFTVSRYMTSYQLIGGTNLITNAVA